MPNEAYLPNLAAVKDDVIDIIDDTTTQFISQFTRKPMQVVSLGGQRLRVKRTCVLGPEDRGLMTAFLGAVRGKQKQFWAQPRYVFRGSFPTTELFTNADFSNGTTGWTAGASTTLTANNRVMRVTSSATSSPNACYQSVAPPAAGQAIMVRAIHVAAAGAVGLYSGVQAGASMGVWGNTDGPRTAVYLPGSTGATNHYIFQGYSDSKAAGSFWSIPYATMRRCGYFDTAKNGTINAFDGGCYVAGLPPSTLGLGRAGDIIEVAGELKILTADVNSDASGNAVVNFEPPMVGTMTLPAKGGATPTSTSGYLPVVFGPGWGKFVLASDPQIINIHGLYAQVDLEMEQVY